MLARASWPARFTPTKSYRVKARFTIPRAPKKTAAV